MKQKFGDMKQGQWFRDHHGRVFVKLQNVLPSGIRCEHHKFCSHKQPEQWKDDSGMRITPPDRPFNAVDSFGIDATCPDWLEFELLETPYKTAEKT